MCGLAKFTGSAKYFVTARTSDCDNRGTFHSKLGSSMLARGTASATSGQAHTKTDDGRFVPTKSPLLVVFSFGNVFGFLLIAFVIVLPLVLNPGYFSSDELQWLAFADTPTLNQVPWSAWFDFSPFQYRPLTFNLWLFLSHFIGYQPVLMHLARIAFGLVAAWLLRSVLLQFDVASRQATLAAWIWLLTPYTVYTHGWVGTFGDSLCLIFMLLALRHVLIQSRTDSWIPAIVDSLPVAALTALALMSKESAVVFPAAMFIAVLRRRDRVGVAAFAASAVVVAIYLGLRLQTILFPHVTADGYHWSLANIPARFAEYTVFPFLVGHFEVIASRTHLANWPALFSLGIVMAASFGAGWRRCLVFWIGWIAALGPVLILDDAYNQYAYLAGAWACAFIAFAWERMPAALRVLLILPIAMLLVHGAQQIRDIRHIGQMQRNLYADLPGILAGATHPIVVRAQRGSDDFILQRLLTDVPSYHRAPVASRVAVVTWSDPRVVPDYRMRGDGHLIPAR